MEREEVYLIDLSGAGFRCGKPARIIGVDMVTPNNLKPRLCYHLKWQDGVEDWKPISEKRYKIVTFTELLDGDYR